MICSNHSEVALNSSITLAQVISAFQRENNSLDLYVHSMFFHESSQQYMTDCTVLRLNIWYLREKEKENKTENPHESIISVLLSMRGLNTN